MIVVDEPMSVLKASLILDFCNSERFVTLPPKPDKQSLHDRHKISEVYLTFSTNLQPRSWSLNAPQTAPG